jgi:hypothetical protein
VTIKKGRIRWAGYVQRMPETRSVKKVFLGKPDGRRRRGRPRKRWLYDLQEDLRKLGVKGWRRKAEDRGMEACGQEGRGPTWAVAPTRRRSLQQTNICSDSLIHHLLWTLKLHYHSQQQITGLYPQSDKSIMYRPFLYNPCYPYLGLELVSKVYILHSMQIFCTE